MDKMNIKMLKFLFTGALLVAGSLTCSLSGQVEGVGVRSNLLSWAFLSPSIGADVSWNGRFMAVVDGSYGDWGVPSGSVYVVRLSSIGAEARRYFSRSGDECWYNPRGGKYFGLYMGIDARYTRFDTRTPSKSYEGNMYTAGVLVGYTFHTLASNWVVDASIGAGYVHREYDSYKWYPPANDYRGLGLKKKKGPGLTNLSVSLAYRFKL